MTDKERIINTPDKDMVINTFLTRTDISNNINSQYGLAYQLQNLLASQNTQFIINLAKELKFTSYSVPSLALHISALFFHKKGYLHFDRFLILGSCFLLASKLKSIECKFKNLCHSFYIITSNLTQNTEPFNEEKMKRLKDQLSIYEAQILRSLQFELEGVTAQDFIRRECQLLYSEQKELGKKIYNTTRIIVLDSYRSLCCLFYHPVVVFVACFLIANRYEGKYPHRSKCLRNLIREEVMSDEQLYEFWLKQLGKKQNIMISCQDVRECLRMINSVLIY